MLQLRSIVGVADNTGEKKVGVFKVLGGSRKRYIVERTEHILNLMIMR